MTTKNPGEAHDKAIATGQSERVLWRAEAAQAGATVGTAGPVIGELLRAFVASAKNFGCFDRIAADAMHIDITTKRVSVFTSVTASRVSNFDQFFVGLPISLYERPRRTSVGPPV